MNNKQKVLSYLTVFIMITMLLVTPYKIVGQKHLVKETGYSKIAKISNIKLGSNAAIINTELLILQEGIVFLCYLILLFTFSHKEQSPISSILKKRWDKDGQIPGAI